VAGISVAAAGWGALIQSKVCNFERSKQGLNVKKGRYNFAYGLNSKLSSYPNNLFSDLRFTVVKVPL